MNTPSNAIEIPKGKELHVCFRARPDFTAKIIEGPAEYRPRKNEIIELKDVENQGFSELAQELSEAEQAIKSAGDFRRFMALLKVLGVKPEDVANQIHS